MWIPHISVAAAEHLSESLRLYVKDILRFGLIGYSQAESVELNNDDLNTSLVANRRRPEVRQGNAPKNVQFTQEQVLL